MVNTEKTSKGSVTRALIICPLLKKSHVLHEDKETRLLEAIGLAEAIELEIVTAEVILLSMSRPATLIGRGNVERLHSIIQSEKIDLVIVDAQLAPVQQRNLERAWHVKVLDRTGLILEIFGARARTREGALQVELAALTYQKSRLVRTWTHLERQRGGFGFMGGPGESQLEKDRRLINDRIIKLEQELEKVKKTRNLHRKARKRTPYPIVALVGYTNAGKSTLFNSLTKAQVFAEDQLFATLDPTMRSVLMPSGYKVIFSDTVGFIRDLPTQLVAAFRATLEEVLEADLLLHVEDVASIDFKKQREAVLEILKELNVETQEKLITVLNKIDLLPEEQEAALREKAKRFPDQICISAIKGIGIEALLTTIDARLTKDQEMVTLKIPLQDGKILAWLYQHAFILDRYENEEEIILKVKISAKEKEKLNFSSPS